MQREASDAASTRLVGSTRREHGEAFMSGNDGFDLDEIDRLLTTTKQVRQRLDLARPVANDELLKCIEIAGHAPMGGNLERNRWMIIDDPATKSAIATRFAEVGRPYLAANAAVRQDERSQRVINSAGF